MANEQKIATTNEIPPGTMKQIMVSGKSICLANVAGEFFAVSDTCTHEQCSLSTGYLDSNVIICACHGAQFDAASGEVLSPPAPSPVQTYQVVVKGTDIYITL